jgi:endoglucanase
MQGLTAMVIFDQIVNALTNANIMVILDNHNSDAEWCCGDDGNYLWYNSRYPESNWINDWKGIVQRYADRPLFIGVDLRNEPRGNATWGGSSNTDWHAAAERGGNAVLSVNRNLLVFVEGISYGTDLSGASRLPVNLNIGNRLVYSAHDYGFFYSGLTESAWLNHITPLWGYLITGNNPQPFWLGEFGTCHTSTACVGSANNADLGYWFTLATNYIIKNSVDWSYWALNGTQSTGGGRTYGSEETYGIVNQQWNAPASTVLSSRMKELESAGTVSSSHVSTLQPETPGANNLCVDVLGVRTDPGAPVGQWTCNNGQNQSFEFDPSSGTASFTIHPEHSGLCLDSNTPSTSQGAVQVTQNTCTGSDQQNWNVNPNSDGSFTLTSPDGKRCLDIDGASTQLKAAVITWPCNGQGNEMFKMPTY